MLEPHLVSPNAGTQVTLWPAQGVVGHPYRAPLWRTAPGLGDCSRTPLDDEIDDEEPVVEVEPEFYDDEIFDEEDAT